jgi:hypothetical protein
MKDFLYIVGKVDEFFEVEIGGEIKLLSENQLIKEVVMFEGTVAQLDEEDFKSYTEYDMVLEQLTRINFDRITIEKCGDEYLVYHHENFFESCGIWNLDVFGSLIYRTDVFEEATHHIIGLANVVVMEEGIMQ